VVHRNIASDAEAVRSWERMLLHYQQDQQQLWSRGAYPRGGKAVRSPADGLIGTVGSCQV